MSPISNDKLLFAERCFQSIADHLSSTQGRFLPETVPVVLVGGGVLESYGIRESGEDIDLFVPGDIASHHVLAEAVNRNMASDETYQDLKGHRPEQDPVEVMGDRDLCSEIDMGQFEHRTDPLVSIDRDGTRFEFKLLDLATMAFAKACQFREKDQKDAIMITNHIGIEAVMEEANRLKGIHGDERMGEYVRDGLSNLAIGLAMDYDQDYQNTIERALSVVDLDEQVMASIHNSFGMSQFSCKPDPWPDGDWVPEPVSPSKDHHAGLDF